MTVQEMHYAVDQGLQKVASSVYDYFLPEEVDFWLNRAQDRYIKHRLAPVFDSKKLGFSKLQKRVDDLRLVITVDYTDGVVPNSALEFVNFDLPVDYMFLINTRIEFHTNNCKTAVSTSDSLVKRELRIVEQDQIYSHIENPFAKPSKVAPSGFIHDDEIRVFQDGEKYILKTVFVDYIRNPVQINLSSSLDCELATHTHQEIVDLAVKNIIEAIESPRYQTNSIEQSKSE
jgi:hypothetical protein